MEGRPSNFDDVAFALFQVMNPGKKLNREQVPYKQLRGMVGELVGKQSSTEHSASSPTPRISFSAGDVAVGAVNGEEKNGNGSSTLDVSDDSSSRLSAEEVVGIRSRRLASTKQMVGKTPKHARAIAQIRARRRKSSFTPKYTTFECTEDELQNAVGSLSEKLLNSCTTSTECYHVLVNSLTNFFTHVTWTNNVEKVTSEFIEENVMLTCSELGTKYDRCGDSMDGMRRIREYELMTLLEIKLLPADESNAVENCDVLNKLRFIYFADDIQRLRDFMDETVCDQFAHIKPMVVSKIYEELCMKVPFDLLEFGREEERKDSRETADECAVLRRRTSLSNSSDQVIKEEEEIESESTDSKSASRTSLSLSQSQSGRTLESYKGESDDDILSPSVSRRSVSVPETPPVKMKRKRPAGTTPRSAKRVVVPQTPLAKMSRYADRHRSRPLSAVLKRSEERRASMTTASCSSKPCSSKSSPAIIASLTRCQRKKPNSPQQNMSPTCFMPSSAERSPWSPKNTRSNSNSTALAKVNLQNKFSRCSTEASTNGSTSSASQHTVTSPSCKDKCSFSIDKGVVERYRKRLDGLRHSTRKSDKNEVFYGRCTSRLNLFEQEDEDEAQGLGVSTRSSTSCGTSSPTLQKNRSGRSVHTNCVYMAHALLNVHNAQPLAPSKAPKQSPFKLHKLVRPASKAHRKRLSKLRIRIQRERVNAPGVSPNSRRIPQSPEEH